MPNCCRPAADRQNSRHRPRRGQDEGRFEDDIDEEEIHCCQFTEKTHRYFPLLRAWWMRSASRFRSSAERFPAESARWAATAFSSEPSKKVCKTRRKAERPARDRGCVG